MKLLVLFLLFNYICAQDGHFNETAFIENLRVPKYISGEQDISRYIQQSTHLGKMKHQWHKLGKEERERIQRKHIEMQLWESKLRKQHEQNSKTDEL